MLSTELKQGGSYSFKLIKEQSQNKFFRVKTDDDQEFKILKFKFQQNQPLPDEIQCYVKSLYPLSLSQDISVHVANFYKEGEEYSFIVKDHIREDTSQYELKDEHGLCFKLSNSPVPLSKGTRVRCKVLKIKDAYVNLKYVSNLGSKFSLDFHSIPQWLHLLNLRKHPARFYERMLRKIPVLDPAYQKYLHRVPGWTLDLLQICTAHITEWLVECRDDLKKLRKICERLELGKKLALYMVQESDFLKKCSDEHRHMLQERLSKYVEQFEQYHTAATMILEKNHVAYIDRMFRRLKNSGYLYRPDEQITIMMTILKLRPELINDRMGELFEALHNWDLANWMAEPFRGALVNQLQLFIEENSEKLNKMPANDSKDDSKVIVRMILALAIQRILANDKDNIDLNLNRAKLYRYISYLSPSDVDTLLEKGVFAILGMDWPNEFTLQETDSPTLLFAKAAHPANPGEEKGIVSKSYITSKAELILTADRLQLIGVGADPDSTVVPNNMFDWLNPSISIIDSVGFPAAKKSKDMKALGKSWNSIAWSLFGGNETTLERIEKQYPEEGDEVMVNIDNVRIDETAPEKQRLQFHCVIKDDSFLGDGWMPVDPLHMVGWLSSKDIPGNYDKSLDFAKDADGNDLLFPATVHFKQDGSLEFSMKRQIDEYLLETTNPGMESVAFVTHLDRANNAWLCLSETGATYKVACDDSTEFLNEKMILRVKYVEQDHSQTTQQFFIGELSEDQTNLPLAMKKGTCLYNLMQSIGIPDEEELPYQVMESEQVMSEEELEELIYILQRKAFSETDDIKAYNYLGLASLLCRLADNKAMEKEISIHMRLLEFLQHFSKNKRLDFQEVKAFSEEIKGTSPMLERLYTRIKIVAGLDTPEESNNLWNISRKPRNETEGKLASLVLSFNMLPKELEIARNPIIDEISEILNITTTISVAKYYGDESQNTEFKSSMIFPAGSKFRPDPQKQLFELAQTVCGFMNARGGKLYIGVNDQGYETGLDNDLAYLKSKGEKPTLDRLNLYLQDYLHKKLPAYALPHIEISSVPDSKKGVIMVDVKAVRKPVELDGTIYVRESTSTRPWLGDAREEFIKNRPSNYDYLLAVWGVPNPYLQETEEKAAQELEKELAKDSVLQEDTKPSTSKSTASVAIESDQKTNVTLQTGRGRHNVLHYYDEHYVSPAFYIYFNPDQTMYVSVEDKYIDHHNNPEECILALAVKDYEKEGSLIVAFEDDTTGTIPMDEVSSLTQMQNTRLKYGSGIKSVNIGKKEDYLLSVIKAASKSLYYRLDRVDQLEEGNINGVSTRILTSLPHKILHQEIVSADKLSFFDNEAINKESNVYGVSVPMGDGTLNDQERIEELLKPLVTE
ncbi:MAG: ATP-binding protein [Muribaculaceae bacterium]|nr:ATP-binding protein [Muribaculaceae bacterium]